MAFVITIKDSTGTPVQGLSLEILDDSQRGHVATVGPSDEDGLCFGSLGAGTYYMTLVASLRGSGSEQVLTVVNEAVYLEVDYDLLPATSEDTNYSDLISKIDQMVVLTAKLSAAFKGLLTKAEVDELKSYLAGLKEDATDLSSQSEQNYRALNERINSITDQYSKTYWENPVATEDDLPDGDVLYVVRVVIAPEVGDDPALFIKTGDSSWTRLSP